MSATTGLNRLHVQWKWALKKAPMSLWFDRPVIEHRGGKEKALLVPLDLLICGCDAADESERAILTSNAKTICSSRAQAARESENRNSSSCWMDMLNETRSSQNNEAHPVQSWVLQKGIALEVARCIFTEGRIHSLSAKCYEHWPSMNSQNA